MEENSSFRIIYLSSTTSRNNAYSNFSFVKKRVYLTPFSVSRSMLIMQMGRLRYSHFCSHTLLPGSLLW